MIKQGGRCLLSWNGHHQIDNVHGHEMDACLNGRVDAIRVIRDSNS